jgi:predicted dehydrogenase
MTQPLCRWGILGTANIARKNWKAIRNAGNAVLTAVASRDVDRARRFINECQADTPQPQAPSPCTYEELLGRRDVDAVYLPLPTVVRRDWVLRTAAAGKHVLCEKPCGVRADDVRAMLDACRKTGVQFMDGVMFMHSKRLGLLREVLEDGQSVGAVRRIASQFSFLASPDFVRSNIRANSDLEPLGCLGDLGWYNLRFSLWVMKEQLPQSVTGCILSTDGPGGRPVPMEFSGELFFADGVSASFYCSFRTQNQQWAEVSGSLGAVRLSDFVLPFYGCESAFEVNRPVFQVLGCDFNMEGHTRRYAVQEYSNSAPDAQETNMIRTFSEIVRSGKPDPRWGEMALRTQQVLEACLASAAADGERMPVTG